MNDPTFGGLIPTRLGYTITPAYGYIEKKDREMRNKAHDAAKAKRLRMPYFQYVYKDETGQAAAMKAAESAAKKASRLTGFDWKPTEVMF
jgi:hypothetical protein